MRQRLALVLVLLPLLQSVLDSSSACRAAARLLPPRSSCWTTFAELDAATAIFAYRTTAFSCPPECGEAASSAGSRGTAAAVFGSFPYHASSSICLAGIHSGLLSAALGGSVLVSRFYRQDWSNSSSQTIFPHGSERGCSSNGVVSRDVEQAWFTLPANGSVWSYTVRGRGELVTQRRQAPFSPRSGHTHAAWPLYFGSIGSAPYHYRSFHIVIGGWDGQHYLNDVHVAEPGDVNGTADLQWRRLPDAPFSPRADLASVVVNLSALDITLLYLLGGQTDHSCGMRELGICSDEVWVLRLDLAGSVDDPAQPQRIVKYSWTTIDSPAFHLPFAPRCGACVYQDHTLGFLVAVGGQLSYSDPSCRAPPQPLNDVHIQPTRGLLRNLSLWTHDDDAPFSPRRSQQTEDVLRRQAPIFSAVLIGGMRIVNMTQQRISALEIFADAWACTVERKNSTHWGCQWDSAQRQPAMTAFTSIPLPTAGGADALIRGAWPLAGQRFGGFTSQAAVRDWLNTAPLLTDSLVIAGAGQLSSPFLNVTALLRPVLNYPVTSSDIRYQRFALPLSYVMTDDEINAATGSYRTGSAWIQSHSPWLVAESAPETTDASAYQPSASTVHYQRYSLSLTPHDDALWLPLMNDSSPTRARLRFELPRLDHRLNAWTNRNNFRMAESIVSGGHSGSLYLNDWISMHEVRCLPPDDPSFAQLLGSVSVDWSASPLSSASSAAFAQNERLSVGCAEGHHWELQSAAQQPVISLYCAPNGVWMDYEALTIRRCVRNELQCSPPLLDLGGRFCQPPRPRIAGLAAVTAGNRGPLTVINLPLTPNTPLRITGSHFSLPLRVTVGGSRCEEAQLLQPETAICYNVSDSASAAASPTLVCDDFAAAVTCMIPAVRGLNLPVLVTSGRFELVASISSEDSHSGIQVATVSSLAPDVVFLGSAHCPGSTALQLVNCPIMADYNVTVCVSQISTFQTPLRLFLGSFEELKCSNWTNRLVFISVGVWARCTQCRVKPQLGVQRIWVQQSDSGVQSTTDASLVSQPCPAGYRTAFEVALNGSRGDPCSICPVGTSTMGSPGASACEPCKPGSFGDEHGLRQCKSCQPGFYSSEAQAVQCQRCQPNSFQPAADSSRCSQCSSDEYVVYDADNATAQPVPVPVPARVSGKCQACPSFASCRSGNISASRGFYLLVDQQAATVRAVPCSPQACVDGASESQCSGDSATGFVPPQLIVRSELPVINCCGPGRLPAFLPKLGEDSELAATDGVNVLCAACLPKHSQMNGVCVYCPAVNWAALSGLLLLGFVLVFLVYRLPSDVRGSATVSILGYFVQQSVLFSAAHSGAASQLLSVLNLDLLGDAATAAGGSQPESGSHWCILPLRSDMERFLVSLASPCIIFCLLLALAVTQLGFRSVLRRCGHRTRTARRAARLYAVIFTPTPYRLPGSDSRPNRAEVEVLHSPLLPAPEAVHGGPRLRDDAVAEADADASRNGNGGPKLAQAVLYYQCASVRLLQLSYSSIVLLSIRFFLVQSVAPFGERLLAYPGIDPASRQYRLLIPIMLTILVCVVCMLPVLLLAYLAMHHRRGTIGALRAEGPRALAAMGLQSALLLQLCGMFHSRYWWMASFVLMRRLLVGLVLVLGSGAEGQSSWIWLTLVNYCLLALHLKLEPYEREADNVLETLTLLSLSLQTSLLSIWLPPYSSPTLLAAINALIIGPLLVGIIRATISRWQSLQAARRAALSLSPDNENIAADS